MSSLLIYEKLDGLAVLRLLLVLAESSIAVLGIPVIQLLLIDGVGASFLTVSMGSDVLIFRSSQEYRR